MIPSLPWLVVACPFTGALVLAWLPGWRRAAWANAAAATLTALLCLGLPAAIHPGAFLDATGMAAHFALLTAGVAAVIAWFSLGALASDPAARRANAPRLRGFHGLFQALLGCLLLAVLARSAGLAWAALAAALLCAALGLAVCGAEDAARRAWAALLPAGAGLLLMLFGLALFMRAGQGANWPVILAHAPGAPPALLAGGFVLLLTGAALLAAVAPMHAWLGDLVSQDRDEHRPAALGLATLLIAALPNAAILPVLPAARVLATAQDAIRPGPVLLGLGVVSIVTAAAGLWRQTEARRFLVLSTAGQTGLVLVAIGLGAVPAALLHMTLHTLTRVAFLQAVALGSQQHGDTCLGRLGNDLPFWTKRALAEADSARRGPALTLGAALLALAALPPCGLFTSTFLILTEAARHAPGLSLPLGIALLAGAWAGARWLRNLAAGPPSPAEDPGPPPTPWQLLPPWLLLGCVVALGLILPAPFADWLRSLAP